MREPAPVLLEHALVQAARDHRAVRDGYGAEDLRSVARILHADAERRAVGAPAMNGNISAQVDEEMLEPLGCHEIDQPVRDPALRRAAHVDRGLGVGKRRDADVVAVQKLQLLPSYVRNGFVEGFLIGDDAPMEIPEPRDRAHRDVEHALGQLAIA